MAQKRYGVVKEITGRIWAVWALILFIFTLLPAFFFYLFCYLMKEPQTARWHRLVSNIWMTFYLNLIGCRLRVKGEGYFAKGQNYVVVCNHNSFMDIPVTTPFMPNANKTIAKKEFTRVPVFGWIYGIGSVLVDRKSTESRKKSYQRMKAVLRLGLDMVIYAEGTRNKTDLPLGNFQDGAFRLAKDSEKPIMPVLLFNTKKVMPASKVLFLLPYPLYMHFLPPVSPEGLSVAELKEKVFKLMWDYYQENEKSL